MPWLLHTNIRNGSSGSCSWIPEPSFPIEQWTKIGAGIKPSLDRLERTFPSIDAYLENVKRAAYLNPWNDAIETYFKYESEEKDGVVRSRIRLEHIAEERKHLAGTDTSAYYENVRCPVLVLRATEGMVTGDDHVLPEDASAELQKVAAPDGTGQR